MQILWDHAVLEGQDRLHQSQRSSGRLGVAEIGLHRCQRAGAVVAVYLGQAGVFDGVTHRGARAVRLDHAHRSRVHTGHIQRLPIRRDLRGP